MRRRERLVPQRENLRPPRYRLMMAAAALPQRKPERPSESFEADCPACGRTVLFTQLVTDDGIDYAIEDHDCHDAREPQPEG